MRYYSVSDKYLKEFKELCDEKGIKYETEAEYKDAASNLINLVGTLVEIDMEECERKRQIVKEPKGFALEGKGRSCSLCQRSVYEDDGWYDKWGFKCINCQDAVNKGLWGTKQFAFRGLIQCGQCGAEFTAQEKFKKLKNGEFNRHVYYNCTRRVDRDCTEKYINEKDLCVILQEFIEKNHDDIYISDKLRSKVERHYQVTKTLLEHYSLEQPLDIPFVEYSRYILVRGAEAERTAFAAGMKTKLQLLNGTLGLASQRK